MPQLCGIFPSPKTTLLVVWISVAWILRRRYKLVQLILRITSQTQLGSAAAVPSLFLWKVKFQSCTINQLEILSCRTSQSSVTPSETQTGQRTRIKKSEILLIIKMKHLTSSAQYWLNLLLKRIEGPKLDTFINNMNIIGKNDPFWYRLVQVHEVFKEYTNS